MANHHYWVKFYFKDWMSNLNLQRCDVAARGLWMDLFCLMQISDKIGYLISKGNRLTTSDIAKLVGLSKRRTERLLQDLLNNGICAYSEDKVLYSPLLISQSEGDLTVNYYQNDCNLNAECNQNEPKNLEKSSSNHKSDDLKSQKKQIYKKEKERMTHKDSEQHHVKRLPVDWQPSIAEMKYAENLGLNANTLKHDFCHYWHEKSGNFALKSDWSMAWYRWCNQASKWRKNTNSASGIGSKQVKTHPLMGFIEEHETQWGDT